MQNDFSYITFVKTDKDIKMEAYFTAQVSYARFELKHNMSSPKYPIT